MKRISLKFPTLHLLWSFAQTLESHKLEINTQSIILTCNCSEENINEALLRYKALLVE